MHPITHSVLPGELVFDIGANAGNKAEWFASRNIQVIAVEPQPHLASHLRSRFHANPLVTIVEKGVADKPGTLTMSISSNHVLSTFSEAWKEGRFKTESWDSQVPVEMTTFDALIAEYGKPRYAKIDVEGFEKHVVSGLSQKVGCLSFEFSAELMDDAELTCARLMEIGFRFFNVSLGENDTYVLENWTSHADVLGFLTRAAGQDSLLWGDIYAA